MVNTALKIAIMDSGLKQTAIAKQLGVNDSILSRIVNGRHAATDEQKRVIAAILRKPVQELFVEVAA